MENKRIIYENGNGGICVVIPVANCGLTIEEIATKDIPVGVPYYIIDKSELPTDRTYRDAWKLDTADMGEPDGVGGAV